MNGSAVPESKPADPTHQGIAIHQGKLMLVPLRKGAGLSAE
jgi:hypothetical protein